MAVMGPGDEAPSFRTSAHDSDDVESNLLKAPGVMLCPAVLTLKLFKAEDIPRFVRINVCPSVRNAFIFLEASLHLSFVRPFVRYPFSKKNPLNS